MVAFLPAALLVPVWLVWISASGGYYPSMWYPSLIGAAALFVITIGAGGRVVPRHRSARIALSAFAGLVAINYLSLLWADSPGSALDASNQLLLYLIVGWIFAILPWSPRSLAVLLGIWAAGITVFCAVDLARATSATSLDSFFVQFRYSTPLGYPNATAALAVIAMWPALLIAARREVPVALRAVFLAVAVFLAQFSLLPQSRAAVLGLALTTPLVLLLSGERTRLLSRMLVVGGGIAFSVPRTVAVDNAISAGRHAAPVLGHAASGMLLSVPVALALGVILALSDGRLELPAAVRVPRPSLGRAGRVAIAVMLILAFGAGAVAAEPPVARLVRTVWHSGRTDASTGSVRLLSATPEERFDYARVALHLFARNPVLGVGAGNYGRHYDALRRFQKHSRYTHDIALRALSETGIAGLLLLLTVLGALATGLWRAMREVEPLGRAMATAAMAVAAYFLIHASLDWLDAYPVLAAPPLAFALAAIAMRSQDAARPRERRQLRGPKLPLPEGAIALAARGGTVLLGTALALAIVLPYLSGRFVVRAVAIYRSSPDAAYADLSRAAALNPWSADPYTSEGTIAINLSDYTRARDAFERSLRREDDYYPRVELALLDAQAGQTASALQELARAARLDVDDPLISQARTMIVSHQTIDIIAFNRTLALGPAVDVFQQQNIRK